MKTTADILNAAADLLEQPGAWTQGEIKYGAIVDAILQAAGPGFNITRACNALRSVIQDAIVCFECAPGRTQAEVVAALRAAARLAQEGGA